MVTRIKVLREMKLKNGILFTGLPGVGLVGKIVVDYLLKEFKAVKIAEVYSDSFPPSVHTRNGYIELIKDDIYYYSFKNQDFVFLAGPVQPALDFRVGSAGDHYEFAQKIVDYAKELGVSKVYTLAGINVGEKRMASEPRIICAATSKQSLDEWKALGAVAEQPEGLISGAAGLILGLAGERGIQGACLMGETNSKLIYGDHGAAQRILELLIKKFGFKVDMSKIKKEAKDIEKAFTQLNKQIEMESRETPEKPSEPLSYIR